MHRTRRGVLASLAGAMSVLGLGGGAVAETTGALQEQTGTNEPEATAWPRPGPDPWRQPAGVAPASEHCPPETLAETWQSPALATGVGSLIVPPAEGGLDQVYASGFDSATSDGGRIYALDPSTGEILEGWPEETSGVPFLWPGGNDLLFYGDVEPASSAVTLVALDPVSGRTKWEQSLPPTKLIVGIRYDADRETVFATTDGPTVTALDASDGSIQWSEDFAQGQNILFPVRQGDSLYIPTNEFDRATQGFDAHLWAIDTAEGVSDRELWSVSRSGMTVSSVPRGTEDTITMSFADQTSGGGGQTELLGLDASDGTEQWSKTRPDDDLLWSLPFFIDDSTLYATAGLTPENADSRGAVTSLELDTGDENWEVDAGSIVLDLQADAENVYSATLAGEVFAVDDDPASSSYGQKSWEKQLRDSSSSSGNSGLSLGCGRLYTGTTGGTVYAIDADDGTELDTFEVAGIIEQVSARRGSVWALGAPTPEGVTGEASENRAYRLDGSSDSQPAEVSVGLDPDTLSLGTDQQRQAGVVVGSAENGVGKYEFIAEVGDIGVATITDVVPAGDPDSSQVSIQNDGSRADVTVDMGGNAFDPGDVEVASLTLSGESTGSTTVSLSGVAVDDDSDEPYDVTEVTGADVTVSDEPGPAPVVGDDPPQDLNGDGLYRDINGDGQLTIADVQVFFDKRKDPVVQNNAEFFNFDEGDPAEVTIADVQALFQDYIEQR